MLIDIMKTRPCKVHPLKPNFYIVKLGCTELELHVSNIIMYTERIKFSNFSKRFILLLL